MQIDELSIPGVKLVTPKIFHDERGYFLEIYQQEKFVAADISACFVQDNESSSVFGVIRGLHWQASPHTQAKLVRVLTGKILDVVLDLRRNSPTFGRHLTIELDDQKKQQLFVPRGLAHGFAVLSETARICYKCDQYYCPAAERTIDPLDPGLKIDWQIPTEQAILSAKDRQGECFSPDSDYQF